MNPELIEVVKRTGAVASMPQVVTRFLDLINDPEFSYDELVAVLSSDPGTAAEILRLANSPLFGVSRRITSLRPALTLLGPRRVRSLVLGRFLVESVGSGMEKLDASYYWRRSLACGVLTARFSEVLAPRMREEAFIAGLLSDVGVAVLAQEMSTAYTPVLKMYCPNGQLDIFELERTCVGGTHAEVSNIILDHWRLPELVCKAVELHHTNVETTGAPEQLAHIISSADIIAKLLCESPDLDKISEQCQGAMAFIDLEVEILYGILEKVEADIEELAGLLRLGIIPNSSYSLIIHTLRNDAATV